MLPMLGLGSLPSPSPEPTSLSGTSGNNNVTNSTDGLSKKQLKQQKKAGKREAEHPPQVKDQRRR